MEARLEKVVQITEVLLGTIKFTTFLTLMLGFLIHHGICYLLIRNEEKRTRFYLKSIRKYALISQVILNIKVIHKGESHNPNGSLIVANHLSYLDILVLAAAYPSLFITSVEIRDTFLLGHISRLAGCFFVERRRSKITPGTKLRELSQMKEKLAQGFNVFLFPEGTSSDGSQVLPFKATFLQLAVDTQTTVTPICIKYLGQAKDKAPWYGDMTFVDHLFKLCLTQEIEVKLIELSRIEGLDKFELAKIAHQQISQCYG